MRRLTQLAAVLLGMAALVGALRPHAAAAGEMGAFIALVNTYGYSQGPLAGNRVLIRSRVAAPVLDQAFDESDRLWYQVLESDRREKVEGSGWTALTAGELRARGAEGVSIYSRPLDAGFRAFQSVSVPGADVEPSRETLRSDDLAQIEWQKVRYVTRAPQKVWVRATAGIYRVGKSQAFLTQAYADMATRSVPKELLTRLLSGVVRAGDSPQDVRWALGEPLRTSEEAAGAGKITLWEYAEAQVRFENAVVKQVE